MNATQALHEVGQSIWLDAIAREMLDSGRLKHYVTDLFVTGLTSNPTIFDHATRHGHDYDASIARAAERGLSAEQIFFRLALEDLTLAAALFQPAHQRTGGQDGWVSLEVSPLLAFKEAALSVEQAITLHAQAALPNLFIKIPGTPTGLRAIEESIFAGVPINVTLLFSMEQYLASADAYMKGIERRLEAGRSPEVQSVASIFISRWDKAVEGQVPDSLRNRLGIAVGERSYRAYCELRESARVRRLVSEGAPVQKLLFASTGTKDPNASDTLYVEALIAPDTIDTMPEKTLLAFAEHGKVGPLLTPEEWECDEVLEEFETAGVDVDGLATQLQREGADAFVKSWVSLLAHIAEKSDELRVGHPDLR
ncbi:transaldolase [Vitiosangium sp. GDMCC 1.1324]|uniref:transaldolase n=1 Tax=Vitiosangium sp. (strain GDMCC 1.1324) TaxID=2138576 RepID=UPI000D3492A0|nr:transaldolase [Vitiosangium sp. GDMCC 1.1324]PTL76379.1 transaldolase [Vitiosangium sp. GDMCC 1.1324]